MAAAKGEPLMSEANPLSLKKQQRSEMIQALKQVKDRSEMRPAFARLLSASG